ncbi:GspH/FimT family pseudopilin [Piscinibacter terrae]|uniref:Type II secretion system protein H n=1 Tax=Piscinibacter terrae TaxID=2496871 RepID=A0A3N7HRT0_9BURK|nr:GspH/FimT family pseudopilin [Albitalea terrae]RQP24957.1 fimbrial assembly protein [Albitalea terrae]
MRTHHTQRGITLIEACIAVAIAAIAVGTAAPQFRQFIDKQRLEGAAAQLATDIRFARAESVMRNANLRLSVQSHGWGSCYIIHSGAASGCECQSDGTASCSGDAVSIKNTAFTATDRLALDSNVASIVFDPMHGTSTPAGTFKVALRGGPAIQHVVNLMGRVRTCSPNTDAPAVPGYAVC